MQNEPEKQRKEALEGSYESEQVQGEVQISPEKLDGIEGKEAKKEHGENARKHLEREAERMPLTFEDTKDLRKQSVAVSMVSDQGKIQRLLKLVEEKGVLFAVKVAKETGDSYVLDLLHDALAKYNLYKRHFENKP